MRLAKQNGLARYTDFNDVKKMTHCFAFYLYEAE